MKKLIYTIAFLLLSQIGFSQTTPNYFPLAVGNKWEYIEPQITTTITRDTIMGNGERYYIFESKPGNYLNFTKYFFTPVDPVRKDEKGDIYVYDDSTQNEYLYLQFSEKACYQTFLGGLWVCLEPRPYFEDSWWVPNGALFIYTNNVGMITRYHGDMADCWGTIYNPCPPFWSQSYILVYAIIDGEKVYSIEDSEEYKWYMRINDVNQPQPLTHPEEISLHQNYPNPFNPETKINFELPKTGSVKLVVYDMLGKEVKTLLYDVFSMGSYSTTWNGTNNANNKVSSGVYYYKLTFNNKEQQVKRMVLTK